MICNYALRSVVNSPSSSLSGTTFLGTTAYIHIICMCICTGQTTDKHTSHAACHLIHAEVGLYTGRGALPRQEVVGVRGDQRQGQQENEAGRHASFREWENHTIRPNVGSLTPPVYVLALNFFSLQYSVWNSSIRPRLLRQDQ